MLHHLHIAERMVARADVFPQRGPAHIPCREQRLPVTSAPSTWRSEAGRQSATKANRVPTAPLEPGIRTRIGRTMPPNPRMHPRRRTRSFRYASDHSERWQPRQEPTRACIVSRLAWFELLSRQTVRIHVVTLPPLSTLCMKSMLLICNASANPRGTTSVFGPFAQSRPRIGTRHFERPYKRERQQSPVPLPFRDGFVSIGVPRLPVHRTVSVEPLCRVQRTHPVSPPDLDNVLQEASSARQDT